nr:MAG TPA: hypothetical protein [Caudoviricetes sp.]
MRIKVRLKSGIENEDFKSEVPMNFWGEGTLCVVT